MSLIGLLPSYLTVIFCPKFLYSIHVLNIKANRVNDSQWPKGTFVRGF